jgi:hypothetical protein
MDSNPQNRDPRKGASVRDIFELPSLQDAPTELGGGGRRMARGAVSATTHDQNAEPPTERTTTTPRRTHAESLGLLRDACPPGGPQTPKRCSSRPTAGFCLCVRDAKKLSPSSWTRAQLQQVKGRTSIIMVVD